MFFEHKDRMAAKRDTVGESGVDLRVQKMNSRASIHTDSCRSDEVNLNFGRLCNGYRRGR